MSSFEERYEIDKRKSHAEAQKRYRAKIKSEGLVQKSSEMSSKDLAHKRELDRKYQKNKKTKMSKEEKDSFKAKDRERKARERKAKKERGMKEKEKKEEDLDALKKKKLRQRRNDNRVQRKIRDERTKEERENRNAEQAESMRLKRSELSTKSKVLEVMKAKEGMRVCRSRKFGYLRKYKQRKIRHEIDPYSYRDVLVDSNGFSTSILFFERREKLNKKKRMYRDSKEVAEQKRKERLKRMNRNRVNKYRLKKKRLLEEPVIIEDYGEKGAYELLRESNIREFERLKQESGLFI